MQVNWFMYMEKNENKDSQFKKQKVNVNDHLLLSKFQKKVDGYLTLDNNDVLTIVIKFKPRHIES